ncbi:MAG: hypothetical protein MUC84_06075 [Solirubrobacteraceae bacterium]|nr:hypothetical protein [Solirubrobacteraceae bacterium]
MVRQATRWSVVFALLGAACLLLLARAPLASAQVPDGFRACPGTFHVLHEDRIGALRLSAGQHRLAVNGAVTCPRAATLLAGFLEDWDGRLPGGWRVNAADREIVRGTSEDAIAIGDAPAPSGATACPQFSVLNDDRIGAVRLQSGRYTMRLLSRRLDCAQAARELHDFLFDTNGLPSPWVAEVAAANDVTFRRGAASAYGFRVRRAFAATQGGGRYPVAGQTRCPGTFLVQNPNRIGALRVPKGMHHLTTFGGVTCPQAVDAFKVFLGRPAGDLPAPWRLRAATASFVRDARGTRGFRVDRAYTG